MYINNKDKALITKVEAPKPQKIKKTKQFRLNCRGTGTEPPEVQPKEAYYATPYEPK